MSLPFLVKKGERVIRSSDATVESKATVTEEKSSMMGLRKKYKSKTVDVKGESGTAYLTNRRLVFVVKKGHWRGKATTILRNASLEDVEGISVSGTFGKGLNIDWADGNHDRYSGLNDVEKWEHDIRAIISGELE